MDDVIRDYQELVRQLIDAVHTTSARGYRPEAFASMVEESVRLRRVVLANQSLKGSGDEIGTDARRD